MCACVCLCVPVCVEVFLYVYMPAPHLALYDVLCDAVSSDGRLHDAQDDEHATQSRRRRELPGLERGQQLTVPAGTHGPGRPGAVTHRVNLNFPNI